MNQQASPNLARAILVFHVIITRGLAVSLENARQGNSALDANRPGFSDYVHSLASLLHAHHLSEDELIFPYLKTVLPEAPYDKLSSDHQLMEPMIETLENANGRWRSGAGEALGEISSSVESLDDLWHPHIAIEEKEIYLPEKLEELIEPQEHIRLMQQSAELSFKNMGPHYLVVPFMLYNLEPGPRSMLASRMPSEMIEQLVPVAWKDQWAPMKPFLLE
jgi:hemerythrin-like domain-containing protein